MTSNNCLQVLLGPAKWSSKARIAQTLERSQDTPMKIVGFTTDAGLRLGLVEGEEVIDLQAVDPTIPNDLAVLLARNNGDLAPLRDIAKRAPASARRPLAGLR